MKIAIIGYGKMGHAIERIALERGHEIVATIDADNTKDIDSEAFASADVAIEFTTPATAADNVMRAAKAGVAVVCGSTGWYDRLPEAEKAVKEAGQALMASTNFSIGVYVTRLINKELTAVMSKLKDYRPELSETHHVHKLDYPSGTAITLAEDIVGADPNLKSYECVGEVRVGTPDEAEQLMTAVEQAEAMPDDILPIIAYREGEVAGIHSMTWSSPVDSIELTHSAISRDGFALGAVMGAEWIKGRKGIFSIDSMMNDILK